MCERGAKEQNQTIEQLQRQTNIQGSINKEKAQTNKQAWANPGHIPKEGLM